jgi:hypothetical protein
MADFVAQLDAINVLAEQSPGFVWRLKAEDGSSSSYIHAFDDERLLVNMSVWESIETLQHYVYRSQHNQVFRDRKKWFETHHSPYLALWWIPAGHIPTVEEGKERLGKLIQHGPTPEAFTFKTAFPPATALSFFQPSNLPLNSAPNEQTP